MEVFSDTITPITALKKLKKVSSHVFMFESAEASKQWGRYTFIGFDPKLEISCKDFQVTIKNSATTTTSSEAPAAVIRKIISENKAPILENMPPFVGGLVGYFSYEYIKYSEPSLKLDVKDEENFKDVDLMLFDKVLCFDNLRQKLER